MKYLSDFASLRETIKHRMETSEHLCALFMGNRIADDVCQERHRSDEAADN